MLVCLLVFVVVLGGKGGWVFFFFNLGGGGYLFQLAVDFLVLATKCQSFYNLSSNLMQSRSLKCFPDLL